MAANKRRKRIQAIDNFEFETFVRTHLATDLADTLIFKLGIRSYSGFLQCDNINDELLAVHDSMDEKDRLHLFLYINTLSSSSPSGVKPGILRELKIFQEECKKQINNHQNNETNSGNSSSTQDEYEPKNLSKRLKTNCNIYRSIMFSARFNDTNDNSKFKYREKPATNEDNITDWSFDQEELWDYVTKSDDLKVSDDLVVKKATNIYVTQQRIHHFFQERMKIKAEDIQKFIFLIQHGLAWHIEQLYEFTMKTRTNKLLFDRFINKFQNYNLGNDDDVKQKVKWLVDFIKVTKYKPSGYDQ